jgi:hypothetical protein
VKLDHPPNCVVVFPRSSFHIREECAPNPARPSISSGLQQLLLDSRPGMRKHPQIALIAKMNLTVPLPAETQARSYPCQL